MDDHTLERLVDYLNRKNKDIGKCILTPREVIEFYQELKMVEPTKAFIRTLNYIDIKYKERK